LIIDLDLGHYYTDNAIFFSYFTTIKTIKEADNIQQPSSIIVYNLRKEIKDKLLKKNRETMEIKYISCQALNNFILFREIKILLKDATMKLKANAQTRIFDIVPDSTHFAPKKILKMSSAQIIMIPISNTTEKATKIKIGFRSFVIETFSLFFSDIR
jgi:hypothetical protein